jgi:hypothetical protein
MRMSQTFEPLRKALEVSWDVDTAYFRAKGASKHSPVGQCFSTALTVWTMLGGVVLRYRPEGGSTHFWNRIADGREVDMTGDQYGAESWTSPPFQGLGEVATVTESWEHNSRYNRLCKRVNRVLSGVLIGEDEDGS